MDMVKKALKKLNKLNIDKVDIAIVSGSGLLAGCPDLTDKITINYEQVGLPKSKVKGHSGSFIFGKYNDKNVAIISRYHFYESGEIDKVRIPLEIMGHLGCRLVVLLTSCGGLNTNYNVGDVMLIKDQINMSGFNPLIAMENIKFTNMLDCYNEELRNKVKRICKENKIDIQEGVFTQMSGPSYETYAEAKMLRGIGADAVSMSTAHDCIIARFLDMKVLGFSVIVNLYDGAKNELTHQEVLDNADRANKKLKTILTQLLNNI